MNSTAGWLQLNDFASVQISKYFQKDVAAQKYWNSSNSFHLTLTERPKLINNCIGNWNQQWQISYQIYFDKEAPRNYEYATWGRSIFQNSRCPNLWQNLKFSHFLVKFKKKFQNFRQFLVKFIKIFKFLAQNFRLKFTLNFTIFGNLFIAKKLWKCYVTGGGEASQA